METREGLEAIAQELQQRLTRKIFSSTMTTGQASVSTSLTFADLEKTVEQVREAARIYYIDTAAAPQVDEEGNGVTYECKPGYGFAKSIFVFHPDYLAAFLGEARARGWIPTSIREKLPPWGWHPRNIVVGG